MTEPTHFYILKIFYQILELKHPEKVADPERPTVLWNAILVGKNSNFHNGVKVLQMRVYGSEEFESEIEILIECYLSSLLE